MSLIFLPDLVSKLSTSGIIAVVVLEDPADAGAMADALLEGGICAVELALRTPRSIEALIAMRKHAPELLLGAGTVIRPEQVKLAQDAGVDFAVAPGTNARVLTAARAAKLPFAPGIVTPSDIETSLEYDCNVLKFFPAEPSGGLAYLRNMTAPYKHLGLHFIPLGGLNVENVATYTEEPSVLAVGGSWVAPKDLIDRKDWKTVAARAREAVEIIRQNS
ncbi:bifunctional 4-hydroxy-2-oxoglutarate aldolase/2-dehydro-3-deoxy-phosphogluconate aldolase [Coraliomargarita sp. SDUM461004]|uniref:Bifunctional 4-hydroxy-2-oxoglutarate aldolase/2-dehydro-3-deoxy-phosphogluconate aldolase n=1 Tax=Thalassobacterium sedimentorum TaxID=3041258 RepID=A0ABU1AF77_9BACT|nr:bifunctional 4-hydroxy-2-oxoglutarate aldolase/2-dehydro-3-deoxy-phosphogluconate aldolase [Coraliomargarita sp. SDUM461004]MDQ8193312.1 bifunctional 4-hydroxy-2-oxoglutarate aldolase/2-dehydro-3-deoxy-phosphogluconate aldolase [Coraliomargarita sp. SDUM461004]